MKKTILILLAIFIASVCYAQPFQKGKTAINIGIGLGTSLGGLGKSSPAISASVDHGLWEIGGSGNISLGGYLGNTGYKYTDLGYTDKWNYVVAGVRGAYHYTGFTSVPNLDVYGGAMLGYNIVSYSSDGNDNSLSGNYGSGMVFSGFLGGRWFFSERVGVYAELGYGVSVLNAGVSFMF